jgi:hypothetical protein
MRGKTVLVNLWATWCLPCLTEMPALDALQGALGGPDFEVVAINIDTRHPDKPKKWLADKSITRLAYYADPQAKVFQDIRSVKKVEGMPISLLVDPAGCELALLQGPGRVGRRRRQGADHRRDRPALSSRTRRSRPDIHKSDKRLQASSFDRKVAGCEPVSARTSCSMTRVGNADTTDRTGAMR